MQHFKTYRNGGIANSIAQRLGPPTAKLFDKEQPLSNATNKKNIFARLGKEVAMVSLKLLVIRITSGLINFTSTYYLIIHWYNKPIYFFTTSQQAMTLKQRVI